MDCRLLCAAFVLAMAMFSSGAVYATDDNAKGAARELANQAKSDFDAGNFEEAGSKFQRAYEIAKVPTLAVWAARSLVKRGHLVAASELYRQASRRCQRRELALTWKRTEKCSRGCSECS
jgi:Flp pilus assembly protein TadD